VLRLRRYERISIENRHFCSNGVSLIKKIQIVGVAAHQPFFLSPNWDKSSFMCYKNMGTSFFCFVANHAFDRRNACSAVKTLQFLVHRVLFDSKIIIF